MIRKIHNKKKKLNSKKIILKIKIKFKKKIKLIILKIIFKKIKQKTHKIVICLAIIQIAR